MTVRTIILGYLATAGAASIATVAAGVRLHTKRRRRDEAVDEVQELDDLITSAPAEVLSAEQVDRRLEALSAGNFLPGYYAGNPLPPARKDVVQ